MINNLSINVDFFKRKIVAPLLIITTLATGAVVGKGVQVKRSNVVSNSDISTIVEANKDRIYFDDFYNYQKDINIKLTDEFQSIDIYDSIELLEKIVELQTKMAPYVMAHDGKNIPDISKEDLKTIPNIDNLSSNFDNLCVEYEKETTPKGKNDILDEIVYINNLLNENKTLPIICIETLKNIIKSQAGGLIGLEESQFENCVIAPTSNKLKQYNATVKYEDNERTYNAKLNLRSGIYYLALNMLCDIQVGLKENEKVDIEKVLKLTKICLATDTRLNNNGTLKDNGVSSEYVKTLKK